mmetsp:Transcript_4484/g.11828  ORF Transcript_4484/g.11828 Transcript_4484/m.11828 type:complete len:205 (-) Transcript_4484:2073-2687(-)
MPTPMCAAWIIATSLAPSPMESVTAPRTLTRTRRTSCAFCDGAHRHATTDWQCCVSSSSASCSEGSFITTEMTSPSSTSACFSPVAAAAAASWPVFCSSACTSRAVGCDLRLSTRMFVRVSKSSHAKAMLIAVSSLSPVSTHTAMPARPMSAMALGTPTCSLSSMAVEPTSIIPCSISPIVRSISLGSSFSFFSSSARSTAAAR